MLTEEGVGVVLHIFESLTPHASRPLPRFSQHEDVHLLMVIMLPRMACGCSTKSQDLYPVRDEAPTTDRNFSRHSALPSGT